MDKIILVCYVDISMMDNEDVPMYMNEVAAILKRENDQILHYLVPIKSESRIECLNPKLVSEEDYAEAKAILERLQSTLGINPQ